MISQEDGSETLPADYFVDRLADQYRLLTVARRSLEVASLGLRQAIHDAWSSGTSSSIIAEMTGMSFAAVEQIALAWPSASAVSEDGLDGDGIVPIHEQNA